MLILTRRIGETVMIGDEVTVEVLSIRGNQVRLGINAPRKFRCTGRKSTDASAASRCRKADARMTTETRSTVDGEMAMSAAHPAEPTTGSSPPTSSRITVMMPSHSRATKP